MTFGPIKTALAEWTDAQIAERFELALTEKPKILRWSAVRLVFKGGQDVCFSAIFARVDENPSTRVKKLIWHTVLNGEEPVHLVFAELAAIGIEKFERTVNPGDEYYDLADSD